MPPVDNNAPAPDSTPTPAPEQPKKLGFWAKLFGKKEATPVAPVTHESQTPEPRLDDVQVADVSAAPVAPAVDTSAPVVPTAAPATDSFGAPVAPAAPEVASEEPKPTPPANPVV